METGPKASRQETSTGFPAGATGLGGSRQGRGSGAQGLPLYGAQTLTGESRQDGASGGILWGVCEQGSISGSSSDPCIRICLVLRSPGVSWVLLFYRLLGSQHSHSGVVVLLGGLHSDFVGCTMAMQKKGPETHSYSHMEPRVLLQRHY